MNLDLNNIVICLFAIAILTGGIAVFAWQRRSMGAWARSFTVLLLSASLWSFGYALEIGLAELDTMIMWAQFQYIGIVMAPVAWFVFARQYTGRAEAHHSGRILQTWVLLLSVFPAITLSLVFTNNWHHLIWQSVEISSMGPYTTLGSTYGSWFWVHSLYSYTLMLGGTISLWSTYFRFDKAYRMQSAVLLIGAFTPWLSNILFLTKTSPFPDIDLSPFGFGLTGVLLTIGIFWIKLFDLVPVARRVAVENMNDGIIILDSNHRIIDINPAGELLIGQKLVDILGRTIDQIKIVGPQIVRLIDEGFSAATEIEVSHKGSLHHYSLQVSSILNKNQTASGRLISLRDITAQERSKRALAKRTQLLETLNSLSTDIASSLDLQIILETVVEAAGELLEVTSVYISEYDIEARTSKVIAEYVSLQANDKERESDLGVVYSLDKDFRLTPNWILDKPVRERATDRYVIHWDDPDATTEEVSHMLQYDCKTAIGVPLWVDDELIGILELWESREKRSVTADDIELIQAIAQQAALALHNSKLYQEAVESSRVKSRILAHINHELRTPLSVILVYTEMLEGEIFGPLLGEQRESLRKVINSTGYLHSLVEQLLVQSEFENGKAVAASETFSAHEIANQIVAQLSILAESKEIELAYQINPDFPDLQIGDKSKIQQILFNLVGNAIKYTKKGRVDFCIFQPDLDHWTIKVSDTGIGISPENHQLIFEPFWQNTGGLKGIPHHGTGLGLSIVKETVNLLNGEISVESEQGGGSQFTVTLPFHPSLDQRHAKHEPEETTLEDVDFLMPAAP